MLVKYNISIIICCFNSSKRLYETLKSISNQNYSSELEIELILVDNNSNDDTSKIAMSIWENFNSSVNLKIFQEEKKGLSNARKKGIEIARGEYLIFCDDDNWLANDYLQISYDIMNSNPNIGMLGGEGEAVFEGEKPEWFERFKLNYAVGKQSNFDGDITNLKGYVYGAGAIIRKSVLDEIYSKGFVSQLTDRVGHQLVSGGDNELGYMIALSGFRIFYSSKLKFKHFMPNNRIRISYLCKLIKGRQLTNHKIATYENVLLNKEYSLPINNVHSFKKFFKQLIKICITTLRKKKKLNDFRLQLTELYYYKYYLLLNRSKFEKEIIQVNKNIAIYKKY